MTENTAAVAVIPADRFNVTKLEWDQVELPETFEAAWKLLEAQGVTVDRAEEVLPDEFPEVDKKDLVNVPVMLLTWVISEPGKGDFDGQYVVVRGITRQGKRFRFSDGSTGIYRQLCKLTEKRVRDGYSTPNAGLIIEKGLVKSDYTFTDEKGKQQPGTTFYLANE